MSAPPGRLAAVAFYLHWLFVLDEIHRFPIPALISQLSPGSVQLILICGSERETLLNNAHMRVCARVCVGGLKSLERHYC